MPLQRHPACVGRRRRWVTSILTFDSTQDYEWPIQVNGHFKKLDIWPACEFCSTRSVLSQVLAVRIRNSFYLRLLYCWLGQYCLTEKENSFHSICRAGIIMFAVAKYSLHLRSALCHLVWGSSKSGSETPIQVIQRRWSSFFCMLKKQDFYIIYILHNFRELLTLASNHIANI